MFLCSVVDPAIQARDRHTNKNMLRRQSLPNDLQLAHFCDIL